MLPRMSSPTHHHPITAAITEIVILVCCTVLIALGKLGTESLVGVASITASSYAVARMFAAAKGYRGKGRDDDEGQGGGEGGNEGDSDPPPRSVRGAIEPRRRDWRAGLAASMLGVLLATGIGQLVSLVRSLVHREIHA